MQDKLVSSLHNYRYNLTGNKTENSLAKGVCEQHKHKSSAEHQYNNTK